MTTTDVFDVFFDQSPDLCLDPVTPIYPSLNRKTFIVDAEP